MNVISNMTIVFDNDAGIEDAVVADDGVSVHDYTGHDERARPEVSRARHDRRWINQGCGWQTLLDPLLKPTVTQAVIPDRHDEIAMAAGFEGRKSSGRRQEFATAKRLAKGHAGVVDKDDLGEAARRSSDIQDHFTVSACPPDDQLTQWLSPKR